ncbi:MAG: tetratricopeptide repeat protein [candidate division Zixibacteria bacterium]|nr:tetratricopeptide repeat protein [candidate division Zixibacteria bacterium]
MSDDRQRSTKPGPPAKTEIESSRGLKITPDFDFRQVSDRLWIGAILLAALVVRILTLWELSRNYPGFFSPDVDSEWHYLWAKIIARGDLVGDGVFYRAPFYPYVLGFWIKLFGEGLWGIKLAQAVLSSLTAVLTGLIGWRIFGRKVGLIAGFAWAFWGPVIYYDSELLLEVLFVPLNLLAVWLTLGRMKESSERLKPWLVIGIILGISAITRPNILITIPVFWWLAWAGTPLRGLDKTKLWRALKRPLILTIGLAIPILPVTARNWWVAGDPVLIAYQGGVNLYLGNNTAADGLTMRMPEILLDPTLSWNRFVVATDSIAVVQSGKPLRASEISSWWTGKAIDYVRAYPGRAIRGWVSKLYYLWNGFEVGDQTNIYDIRRFSVILRTLIWRWPVYFPFGLIAPLALIGIGWTWRRYTMARPLAIFITLYSLSVVGFLATARHRLPMVPFLVIFAIAGAWLLVNAIRQHRMSTAGFTMLVTAALIVILNLPTVDHIMENPSFTAYQEGLSYERQGNYPSAVAAYERALLLEPYNLAARRNLALGLVKTRQYDSAIAVSFSYLRERQSDADAMNNLGLAYLGKSDTDNALSSFRITARASSKLGQPHFNMGEIAAARGQIDEAAGHYRDAIKADSLYGAAYNALGILYAKQGQLDSAIAVLKRCTTNVPEYATAWANLGGVSLQANEPQIAIDPLKHALDLNPRSVAIRFNLALAYSRSGNASEATRQLREILAIDPSHQGAQQLLSTLEAQGGGGK